MKFNIMMIIVNYVMRNLSKIIYCFFFIYFVTEQTINKEMRRSTDEENQYGKNLSSHHNLI